MNGQARGNSSIRQAAKVLPFRYGPSGARRFPQGPSGARRFSRMAVPAVPVRQAGGRADASGLKVTLRRVVHTPPGQRGQLV
jgi:hypothetical protein